MDPKEAQKLAKRLARASKGKYIALGGFIARPLARNSD
jgi:hypothetical protein